jgi:beta-phosphoglucomutase
MPAASTLRAAIFDMDGTLVDNMSFHAQAWVETSRSLGLSTTPELFEREYAGKKNEEIFPLLLGRSIGAEELARLAEQKESLYRALYAPHLKLAPGAQGFLTRLSATGIRLAVATAAPPGNRSFVLDRLELRRFFPKVVGPEDAPRGKPAPDLFLAAARAIDVPPSHCVAFEDALNGVRSAVAAGMLAVGITSTTPAQMLRDAGARWTLPDFTSLPPDLERMLFE